MEGRSVKVVECAALSLGVKFNLKANRIEGGLF